MLQVDFDKLGLKVPERVIPMTTGSASANYYIKNPDGEFLVKLKRNPKRIKLLSENYKEISGHPYCPELIFEKAFENFHVFVSKWTEGRSYFLEKIPPATLKQIITAYLSFLTLINKNQDKSVMPAEIPAEFYDKIKSPYAFMVPELEAIKKDLIYRPKLQIIHGDFHFKNIIIKNNELQSFIDFESFQWGIPTEDLMRLLLTNAEQHRFFRTKYTVRLLKFLIQETHYSKNDWLYGFNVFVLNRYEKKLRKKSPIRWLSLYRCTLLYRKLRRVIYETFR